MIQRSKLLRYMIILLMLAGVSSSVHGQFYTTGQDPASLRWRQIQTPHFQVIFPRNFEDKARYVANMLEYAYGRADRSLDHEPRKTSVIIHNRSVISNGFVAPAPHRMELFSTPPQDNLDMPWLEHLAIHEYRHVVQIDKLDQGLTRLLGYIFGQQANAVVAGMMPMWYYEGDAVIAETALTSDGRGRSPSFTREIRTWLADTIPPFSFDKMLLGSYRDKTPDHYQLGYHMTAYGRASHGTGLWEKVERYVGKRPYQLFSFNFALNRYFGDYSGGLYDSAMTRFGEIYDEPAAPKQERGERIAGEDHEDFLSYRFPEATDEGILVLKEGFSKLPGFVLLTSSGEERIHTPGPMTFDGFSYANGLIAWSERVPDMRWGNRSYSVVKLYDIERQREFTLKKKTRWFAPTLSPDGRKVAAVQAGKNNPYSLVVSSVGERQPIKSFSHPDSLFLQQPVWSVDGRSIYVIGLTNKGKGIYRVDYRSGSWFTILAPVYREINHLSAGDDHVFFRAAVGERDQICALDPKRNNLYQVTRSPINASDVSYNPATHTLLYAGYDANGYDIRRLQIDRDDFESLARKGASRNPVLNTLIRQEDSLFHSAAVPKTHYPARPYKKWANLFHFHSWAPFYMDYNMNNPVLTQINPGITLFSQNLLSTALTSLGYSYSNSAHHFHSRFTYRGWYPVFQFSTDYGGKPGVLRHPSVDWKPELSNNSMRFEASLSLPLNFSRGKNIAGATPSVSYEYDRTYYHLLQDDHYYNGLKTIDYGLWFYAYRRMAYRDLQPKWGVTFNVNHRASPFSEKILGEMTSMAGRLYLPGLMEDHGVTLALGYQKQDPEAYLYSTYLDFPRGFKPHAIEELFTFDSEYVLPLGYPDWNIPSLLYVKRLKGSVFYDYAWKQFRAREGNSIVWKEQQLHSTGAELTFDFHLARVMFPFTAGVRYSYLPQLEDYRIEFIFDVNFHRIYSKLSR